jgi:hypothetical protein
MKKLLVIFTVVAASLATVMASDLITTDLGAISVSFEKKVKITPSELPDPVKTSVEKNFADWDISAAYLYTESKQYEIEFQMEGQTQTVKFDKDGNILS